MAFKLFDVFGIEMEYMLVDRDTLCVRPVADQLLADLNGGQVATDFASGPATWSNELALHVVELKTTVPTPEAHPLFKQFEAAIGNLRPTLDRLNLRLLPTAMHPWMNPASETILWPHEYADVYRAYDRIFDCQRHGWANVQSVHLNLPFDGDIEFGKLHAAIRLILPILPALTASSPIIDGRYSGMLDTRLHHYADHCRAMPSLTGNVIPEAIFDEATYRREIFDRIGDELAKTKCEDVFEVDFLNARGAIARFDRGSIEIRVMDVQEYPVADVAVCGVVIAVIKALVSEQWSSTKIQQALSTAQLRKILDDVTVAAENTMIADRAFLSALGMHEANYRAADIWSELLSSVLSSDPRLKQVCAPVELIQRHGTLATRICQALGSEWEQAKLHNVYARLADCLEQWNSFMP